MTRQALHNIKVFELATAATGPMMGKFLADFGATVVRVESATFTDIGRTAPPFKDYKVGLNRSGFFCITNNNKYGVTLNLNNAKAIEIAKRFILWCDIYIENFRPGVVARWGLDYDSVKKIKPTIIMLSTCMQGQTGPRASFPGFGGQLVSLTGFTHLTGWPDRSPVRPFQAYTDVIGPRFGTGALISALIYRNRTGKGQYFDLSQYETGLHFLSPLILDYAVNGRVANRMGNRCPYAAPHGAYPCKEQDSWCVITVFTDSQWRSLCQIMGEPSWAKEEKFATLLARKQNEEELDGLIGEWTINFNANEVMSRLQNIGVPAGVVKDAQEMFSDPQLAHRGHFKELEHPEIGKQSYYDQGFRLSKTPSNINRAAPCQGEHNEYVYTQILGMSDEEFVELLAEGVFD